MIFSSRGVSVFDLRRLLAQIQVDHGIGGRDAVLIDDEIAQMRLFFLANRRFERYRLLRHAQHFADFSTPAVAAAWPASSLVGSRPSSCTIWREVRISC